MFFFLHQKPYSFEAESDIFGSLSLFEVAHWMLFHAYHLWLYLVHHLKQFYAFLYIGQTIHFLAQAVILLSYTYRRWLYYPVEQSHVLYCVGDK